MNIRPVLLSIALLTLCSGIPAIGAPEVASVVISVDTGNSTITINQRGQTKVFHVDPFGTVFLNGAESSLKQLSPGMVVSSLSLSDPTTISEIKISEVRPAVSSGAAYGSTIPAPELATLMAKVGNSYWTNSPTSWIYLSADGKLVDSYHDHFLGRWTLSDRHTLLIIDDAMQNSGAQRPSLCTLDASYTTAGDWVRQPVPTAAMQEKVTRMNP